MEWNTSSSVLEGLRDFEAQGAWELFVGTFHETLVRFARRRGLGAGDAEDASQEALLAFAQAYRSGSYEREKGRLKHWLFGIAQRQIAARLRQVHRRREQAEADLGRPSQVIEPAVSDGLDELWEEEWRRTVYERALEQVRLEVTPQTFELFERLVYRGEETEQIVAEMGVPRTKVYNAKSRVTQRLAELVREFDDA